MDLRDAVTVVTGAGSGIGAALARRLEVSPRTVRRAVARLRALGYPVDAVSGPAGGEEGTLSGTAQAADGEALGYCMREYITVSGGKFYALIYYNSSDELSAAELKEAGDVFASLKLKSEGGSRASGGYILLMRIVAAVLIVVAAVIAVFIISTFVRDIRLKKDSPEVIPEHIKMHRK